MSTLPSSRPRGKIILVVLLLIVVAVLAAGGLYLRPRFESEPPRITVSPSADVLGTAPLEIRIADTGTGLKSVAATLSQGGNELNLAAEQFAQPAGEKNLAVALAKLPGVKEGPAVLRVAARDAALFRANEAVLEKNVVIDITPPTLELVADDRYVNFGGVGVVVYKASADTATSGVKIGTHFFPGFAGQVKDRPDHFLAFFAHPYAVTSIGQSNSARDISTDVVGGNHNSRSPIAKDVDTVTTESVDGQPSDGCVGSLDGQSCHV